MDAIDAKFVMQVWAGCQPCHADIADYLALVNLSAAIDAARKAGHMTVECAVFGAMLQDDDVTIAALDAAEDDLAVTGGPDGRAG